MSAEEKSRLVPEPVIAEDCMVLDCVQPAVVLLSNDEVCTSPEYREWWACRWHRNNPTPELKPWADA